MNNKTRKKTTREALLVLSVTAMTMTSPSVIAAAQFPGGKPITQADLTVMPAVLPVAPPKYDTKMPITHEEYARFAWRQFIYYNSPTKKAAKNMPGVTPIVRGVIDPTSNFLTSGKNNFYASGKVAPQNFSSNILMWESFAHRVELFPNGSAATGDLKSLTPEYNFKNVQVSNTEARFNNLDENSQIGLDKIFFPANGNTPSKNPYDDHEILFQAKVNQTEYDHVKSFGTTAPTTFELPPTIGNSDESVEIKAAWRVLTSSMISSGRYHTAEAVYYMDTCNTGGSLSSCKKSDLVANAHIATFGLVGLHILRKMENYNTFVYSTFEHVDNIKTDGGKGKDTGLYYINLYTDLSYDGSEPIDKQPTVVLNTGPSRVTDTIPKEGKVIAENGYDFIPGSYTLPKGTTGPIKVIQPSTETIAVLSVNNEVQAAMKSSGMFTDSVWQYYKLKGVQPVPTNEDISTSSPSNPLTQDFFLANNVIESSQPGVQLFKGGIDLGAAKDNGDATFTNKRTKNIFNVAGYPEDLTMGGCMGCHGNATYPNQDKMKTKTLTSIFSFLINEDRLNGLDRFDAEPINELDVDLENKSDVYGF